MKCIFWMLIWMWWSGCDERTTDKPKFRLAKRISYAGRPAMPLSTLSTLSYRDSYRAIELPAHSFRWMGIEIGWLLGMRRFRCHFNEIISFRNSTIRILLERSNSVFTSLLFHRWNWWKKQVAELTIEADGKSWWKKPMAFTAGYAIRAFHENFQLKSMRRRSNWTNCPRWSPCWFSWPAIWFHPVFPFERHYYLKTVISNKIPIYQACFTLPSFFLGSFQVLSRFFFQALLISSKLFEAFPISFPNTSSSNRWCWTFRV